jgi:hypothetical protein
MIAKTNKSLSGTYHHGHVVKTTYNNLVKAFGSAQYEFGDKSNHDWHLESNGIVFSIYDWKEFQTPSHFPDMEFEWHIGAFTYEDSLMAQLEICHYLDNVDNDSEYEDRLNYLLGYLSDPGEATRYADMDPQYWPEGIPTENEPWKDNGPETDSAGYNKFDKADEIVAMLKSMDVDGETMEYIIRRVGMDDQMTRQLVYNHIENQK